MLAACALDMAAEAMAVRCVELRGGVAVLCGMGMCSVVLAVGKACDAARTGRRRQTCSGARQAVRLGEGWPVRWC